MDRQRQAPPFDHTPPRRRDSRGGPVVLGVRRTLAPGMDSESTRYPGTANDTLIRRDKTGWYPIERVSAAGDSWVNWTAAGPPRLELNMRNCTVRPMVGNSRTRQLQYGPEPAMPEPRHGVVPESAHYWPGLHTDPKAPAAGTIARYTNANPKIRRPRQDRLLSGQYTGQSYSQTTRTQGAR